MKGYITKILFKQNLYPARKEFWNKQILFNINEIKVHENSVFKIINDKNMNMNNSLLVTSEVYKTYINLKQLVVYTRNYIYYINLFVE